MKIFGLEEKKTEKENEKNNWRRKIFGPEEKKTKKKRKKTVGE